MASKSEVTERYDATGKHDATERNDAEEANSEEEPTVTENIDSTKEKEESYFDEGAHEKYEYDIEKYPVREVEWNFSWMSDTIAFNPVVSAIGIIVLWGVSIWCMVDPDSSSKHLSNWQGNVTLKFTWLFIGARAGFFFFLVYVAFKYGHIKLGKKDEEPEFDTGSYFAMIFAAGVAVGLFVFGVAEPLYHLDSNYYANSGYRAQDDIALYAINMTLTNWGIASWSPYLIVAVGMGLAGWRFNLPMTFRSCFFPILGSYTWGYMGDVIDAFAIVVTVAGVCTSLGLGAIQMVAGFQALEWVDNDLSVDRLQTIQIITIWAVTMIATASVISGLHAGVRLLSQLAFGLGMVLLFIVFAMDNSKFLLNLIVQEVGYYLQWSLIQLNFWTDSYGQLRAGEGRAIDGNAGDADWMNSWMVFYQAWWISWSCFVGLFVARISRGRTLFEVIIYSLIAPIAYCIIWFCIWGGIGQRQARQAAELRVLGAFYYGDAEEFKVPDSDICYNVPQENLHDENGTEIFTNYLLGVTPVCLFDPSNSLQAAFNVLASFSFPDSFENGMGDTLTFLFIVALAIYFATSSDSGSLIVDYLASNGRANHHWSQRLFWAFTEGAVATALLGAGGSDSLNALQAASIIAGLPFVIFLIFIAQSISIMCERAEASEEMEYHFPDQPEFAMPVYGGIFNVFEYLCSFGKVHPKRIEKGMHLPSKFQVMEFIKCIFVPFWTLYKVLSIAYPKNKASNKRSTCIYCILYYTWVGLFIASGPVPGVVGWAWTFFFATGFMLTSIRLSFRGRYNIRSNVLGDWISSTFIWPQVFVQMHQHVIECGPTKDEAD